VTDLPLERDAERLRALRDLLPATGAGIYLDTATFGPLPAEAAEAMRQADEWELRVGRITEGRESDVAQRSEEARAVIAALLGGQPSQVVLARGVDEAVDLARRSLDAPIELVPHASAIDGALTPLDGLRDQAVAGGTRVVLDATLTAGAIPLNVEDLNVDAVVLAADRWLLGPEGTAALWLRERAAALVHVPALPRTTLVGLARSVGWLEMYVGLDWVYERTARLAARLRARLAAIEQLDVPTPSPPPSAIVSFRFAGWPAQAAAEELGRRVFALLRPLPEQELLRASVGWFNTEEELDRLADAVLLLAGHTPDTLPRRPPLVVQ
jgi:selenocysteine lyase/cysteine desulfurase